MNQSPELSLVVPFYNEAEAAAALIDEIQRALSGKLSYEIIAVDDGSTDETVAVLQRLLQEKKCPLRLLLHAGNYGQSSALHTGIRAARAAWVATLDGDGQNDPADILTLLAARDRSMLPHLQLITGHRKKRRDHLVKIISSRVANLVRGSILRDQTPDTGCGLKLIHRKTYLALPFFDHMHRFLPALFQREGGRVLHCPVNHRPRRAGRSKYGIADRLWVGIVDLMGVWWLRRRAMRADERTSAARAISRSTASRDGA